MSIPSAWGKLISRCRSLRQINDAARWDHQREKVYARTNKRLARVDRNAPRARWTVPINRVVECEEQRPTHCTACGANVDISMGTTEPNRLRFQIIGCWSQTMGCAVFLPPLHLLAMQGDFSSICPPGQVWQYNVRVHRLPNHRTAANLGGHLKTGQSGSPQNRPVRRLSFRTRISFTLPFAVLASLFL